MSGGGKGGSTTSSVEIPEELKQFAIDNLERAKATSSIGYVPYQGATVAGLSAPQMAAGMNTERAANAFGLPGGSQFGTSLAGASGKGGNMSPYPMFQQQQALIPQGQRQAIDQFFIDPVTGAAPTWQPPRPEPVQNINNNMNNNNVYGNNEGMGPGSTLGGDSISGASFGSFGDWGDAMGWGGNDGGFPDATFGNDEEDAWGGNGGLY